MRMFLTWPLTGLFAAALAGLGAGCGSSDVERIEVPAIAPPPAVPIEEMSEADRPTEGSSAGMNFNPTRGATYD